jgi:hypothetical protein
VPERERHDPLLKMRADLVGHPRTPTLAHVEGFQAPAIDAALEAVVGRAIHAHQPARGRHVAQLLGEREQPQAESDEHVMLCHPALPSLVSQPED